MQHAGKIGLSAMLLCAMAAAGSDTYAQRASKSTPLTGSPAQKLSKPPFNGGFEAGVGDVPDQWFPAAPPDSSNFITFRWNKDVSHGGGRSASIQIAENHPTDRKIFYNWTTTVPDFEIGATYEISGWVKMENLKVPAWIVTQCWSENRKLLSIGSSQAELIDTGDWTVLRHVVTVPDGTVEVRLRAGITAPDANGGKAWFDDIQVVKIKNAPPSKAK